jgi:hypothetical protein
MSGRAVAVVPHEELFQRRCAAGETLDLRACERGQERLDGSGDLAAHVAVGDSEVADALDARHVRNGAREVGLDLHRPEVAHLLEGADIGEPSVTKDRDAVAHGLHLGEQVRREEDRLSAVAGLADARPERALHQGIEPGRRLVEDEKVGASHEGGDQDDLLAVPPGVCAHALRWIESEPLDQLVAVGRVDVPVGDSEEVQRFRSGQRRPQVRLTRDEGKTPMNLHRVPLAVQAEDLRVAGRRDGQIEQEPDGRRLPGTVRPQVAEDLARADVEVECIECRALAVGLRQPDGRDRSSHSRLFIEVSIAYA